MTDTQTEAAKKREPSKIEIEFTNGNEFTTRIPDAVVGMRVKEVATEKDYTYKLSDLPQSVIQSLAAAGMKKVMETHIRNHMDDDGSNVLELAAQIFGTLASGKLYTREGGKGKTGPKFDLEFWTEVGKSFYKRKTGNEMTVQQVQAYSNKLDLMEPEMRKKAIAGWKKDPHFNAAYLAIKATRAAKDAGGNEGGADVLADLF